MAVINIYVNAVMNLYIIIWECSKHTRAGHSREVDLFSGSSLSLQTTVCSTRNTWNTEWIRIHSLCCQSESSNSIRACRKKQELSVNTQIKRFLSSTSIKNTAPLTYQWKSWLIMQNNDHNRLIIVVHYTTFNVCKLYSINNNT